MFSKLQILALILLLCIADNCRDAPVYLKALQDTHIISWEAIVWAIEMKNIVKICRSVEGHFCLPKNSVSVASTWSLNFLNANGKYSPKEITWVRFAVANVSQETVIVFKSYFKDPSFVEIYQRHKKSYGEEFVFTTWREPMVVTVKSELLVPPQFVTDQHCNWLGKLFPGKHGGGLNTNLNSLMNGLIFAYFTGMAYLVPEVPVRFEVCHAERCKRNKPFTYIWDLEHLKRHASWLGVKLEKKAPKCTTKQRHLNKKTMWVYENDVNEILKKYSACAGLKSRNRVKKSSCYEGVVYYDTMFASFSPRYSEYWGLWSVIRNAFKFSTEILRYADQMISYIGQPFASFHLRIEEDVELRISRVARWDTFYKLLPIRFKECNISTSEPVVVMTGLPPGDPKRARTIDALKDWNLTWPEDFEHIYKTLDNSGELNRRAAIQYALCLRSTKHMGFFDSAFDVNLRVDRRLRNGHFSHNVFPIYKFKVTNVYEFFQKTVYSVLLTKV